MAIALILALLQSQSGPSAALMMYKQTPTPHSELVQSNRAPIQADSAEYELLDGQQCGGRGMQFWANGDSTDYGQGFVNDLVGCQTTCSAHADCLGFNLQKSDNRCSFWQGGSLQPQADGGYQCYKKKAGDVTVFVHPRTSKCPPGQAQVTTMEDCEKEALALGIPFDQQGDAGWGYAVSTVPPGCFVNQAHSVRFNHHPTGGAFNNDWIGAMICQEAVTPAPPTPAPPTPSPPCDTSTGTCTVEEDPHISVFDGPQISLEALKGMEAAVKMSSGDKWLVKSRDVSIQARYMPDETLKEKNEFVRAVAVGGAFLQGNLITVGSLEDPITWNGQPILNGEAGSFQFIVDDGNFSVQIERSDRSLNVATMEENSGIDIKLPLGVSLIVNRLHHHLNVAITMPQQEGGQDGLCGNFNGIAADDSLEFASRRFDPSVPREASLFTGLTFS